MAARHSQLPGWARDTITPELKRLDEGLDAKPIVLLDRR